MRGSGGADTEKGLIFNVLRIASNCLNAEMYSLIKNFSYIIVLTQIPLNMGPSHTNASFLKVIHLSYKLNLFTIVQTWMITIISL